MKARHHYAQISVELKQVGKPIPMNDLWLPRYAASTPYHSFGWGLPFRCRGIQKVDCSRLSCSILDGANRKALTETVRPIFDRDEKLRTGDFAEETYERGRDARDASALLNSLQH